MWPTSRAKYLPDPQQQQAKKWNKFNRAEIQFQRLPGKITERNEKLKEQMLGSLKDIGNKLLRPFGLSTENFKLQQDPNSGSYTINFNQGKWNS